MYKKKSFYLSLVFIALLLSGCGTRDKNKVEYQKTYHRNGKLFEVTPYEKGKVHGIKLEYYADGALRKEVPYDSGRVHGTVKFYYPDGKLFFRLMVRLTDWLRNTIKTVPFIAKRHT